MTKSALVRCLPLPRIPGPKLGPFTPTGNADIAFIGNLGCSENKDSYVWEVKIHGKPYALKMFEFNHWRCLADGSGKYINTALTERQFFYDYFDPFSCECRVFGRLKDEQREDLAIRAHGYLLLTPEQEAQITTMITGEPHEPDDKEPELDGTKIWGRYEQHRGQAIRAIVKELVTDNDGSLVEEIPQMWSDLKGLHELGIVVRDIHPANYLRGKLVDFSRAWTMYHPCLDKGRVAASRMRSFRRADATGLEDMLDAAGVLFEDVPKEVREAAAGVGDCGNDPDPTLYRWIGQDDGGAATHVNHELYNEGADRYEAEDWSD